MAHQRLWIGSRKGLIEMARGAQGWRVQATHFLGEPVSMILPDARDGRLYASLSTGHYGTKLWVLERQDGQWRELIAPAFPPKPANSSDPLAWALHSIWSLEAGGADQPQRLWAGTLPGGLFRSEDSGASWRLVRSLWDNPARLEWGGGGYDFPGIHSICVDPKDSARITVAISTGGVWRSDDAGDSWRLCAKGMTAVYMPPELAHSEVHQDAHRVVQSAQDHNVFWCQHHNEMSVSHDNCASWQKLAVPLADFGFTVVTHPRDAATAWFIPAQKDERRVPVDLALCVLRTRDGGKNFEQLRKGLPQEACYDLIYRHALAVDDTGNTLAMASTTGGLWISDDGGDSWTAPSVRLPPVACVRFG